MADEQAQLPHSCSAYLGEGAHVGKVGVHGTPIGEVLAHPLHEVAEAAVGQLVCKEMGRRPHDTQGADWLILSPLPDSFSHVVTLNPVPLWEAPSLTIVKDD